MAVKKSFLVYLDWRQHLELLSDEERGRLFIALFDYQENSKLPAFSGALQMAFSFIRAQIDRDMEAYERKCSTNQDNGKKGGRPPKYEEQ